ncbi:MAG: 4-phosphoerythronate dehydrogenase [Bacteroidota bacterium]|nr:4-phosphoerythronate dehydrogenase [Bacteroidota bacterium]
MRFEVVADVNIPCIRKAFSQQGRVHLRRGEEIVPADCRRADLLLVRSVTPVTEALLAGSRVRFVGSATAGTEHVDTDLFSARGIAFAHAPGSNAGSVVEYVLTALLDLSVRFDRPLFGMTLGIIGCGHIGSMLAMRAPALGLNVLRNDPPLQARGERGFVALPELLSAADIVTLHVPLTRDTRHLISDETLAQLRPGSWLINTSRGAVADGSAVKKAIRRGQLQAVVLDVWEDEPHIDVELLEQATLATPHIAGYSFDGKIAGTVMLYQAVVDHFGLEAQWGYEALLEPDMPRPLQVPAEVHRPEKWLRELARLVYDLEADDRRMRRGAELSLSRRAAYFRHLRATYPRRRAFETFRVRDVPAALQHAVTAGLALCIAQ